MDTPEERLRQIVADTLSVAPASVQAAARLRDDLGADSFDLSSIVIDTEEAFDIDIDDDQIEALRTFGDLVALVARINAEDAA